MGPAQQPDERIRRPEAWVPLLAGVAWWVLGLSEGLAGFLVAVIPGTLLLATGVAELLWSAERRGLQFCALGGAIGVVLAVPALFAIGVGSALLLAALSAGSFLAAGLMSLSLVPHPEGVPAPDRGFSLAAKTAVDEALLSTMGISGSLPTPSQATRIREELESALGMFGDRGWIEKPESYHRAPLPLEAPRIRAARHRGREYEHLSFDSEYEPHPDEPGRERWLGYEANRTAHAWVVRKDPEAPWLVCIHGYQMGTPLQDLGAFDPRRYHDQLGMNLVLPVLPLHGRRKLGRRSGEGFLSGNALDTVHAEAQAMWDIRRLISWVRAQGAPAVGVMGLSLGGYNTALLASVEEGLACAIPGIPATDFASLLWLHSSDREVAVWDAAGLERDALVRLYRVVSPLAMEPKVPFQARSIFAGIVDRLVPPADVVALHEHWGEPRITWYQGGHVTFMRDAAVREGIEATLRVGSLVP